MAIRGRILKGIVISTKMTRTIVLRRDYLRWVVKYRRYEKRHKTVSAHCSPCFLVKDGDVVTVGQCRPLSKTVRFNVLKVDSATEAGAMRVRYCGRRRGRGRGVVDCEGYGGESAS